MNFLFIVARDIIRGSEINDVLSHRTNNYDEIQWCVII